MVDPISFDIVTYEDAVAASMSLVDFERNINSPGHSHFHLERVKMMMDFLSNPQDAIPAVHVAGTKGKGSTAAMVASILSHAGYNCGLTTSPHLHSVTERISISGDPISKEEFARIVRELWPIVQRVEQVGEHGSLSWFEFMVSCAFYYFHESEVDFQVVETGLGGRLDATNIIDPLVSVITSISLDHTSILGDTIQEIAFEKSGIIKTKRPVVLAGQNDEAQKVLYSVAQDKCSPLVDSAEQFNVDVLSMDITGQVLAVEGPSCTYNFRLPLLGRHQVENAMAAIATVRVIDEQGFSVPDSSVESGLASVRWPARMDVISDSDPVVMVDGAHNPYSVKILTRAIRDYFTYRSLIVVWGVLKGHDLDHMLIELKELDPILIAVGSKHPKSVSIDKIKLAAERHGIRVGATCKTVAAGIDLALKLSNRSDLIVGTGSLSIAAECIEVLNGMESEEYFNL